MANEKQQSEENRKALLVARTGGALEALKRAKQAINASKNNRTITVKDENDEPIFSFQVRPLTEREYEQARERAKKGNNNPTLSDQRGELIYLATVDEDKALWNSREVKEYYDTNWERDIIDETFRSGDKIAICDIIDEISGYGAKNQNIDVTNETKN